MQEIINMNVLAFCFSTIIIKPKLTALYSSYGKYDMSSCFKFHLPSTTNETALYFLIQNFDKGIPKTNKSTKFTELK